MTATAKKTSAKRAAPDAPDAGLYVHAGELAACAPLVAGQPTVAVELGTDNGPNGVGLLRRVEIDDAGKIVGVYLETADDLARTLIQSSVGFRIIQGGYAEKEYGRYVKNLSDYIAETQEESEARLGDNAMSPPEAIARALAAASGGRVMGIQIADEDEEIPPPVRSKTKH